MIEVRPKYVHANHVRIYHQIGKMCEVSSDISKLYEIAPSKNTVQLSTILYHTQLLGGI